MGSDIAILVLSFPATVIGHVGFSSLPIDDILVPQRSQAAGDGDNYSMAQSVVPAVGDRWIYHFTHVSNLSAIRAAGMLRCDSAAL
jgi:hypothetical protein